MSGPEFTNRKQTHDSSRFSRGPTPDGKTDAGPRCATPQRHLRFHLPHRHLAPTFGNDWFALKAEAFARFFGTLVFLVGQTLVVVVWIVGNVAGLLKFDLYPFILLNLAFSLQAAYAASLILLAQTRQADRDKAHNDADALHREALASESAKRQAVAATQGAQLMVLMQQNTELTELTKKLTERVEMLTAELHRKLVLADVASPGAET